MTPDPKETDPFLGQKHNGYTWRTQKHDKKWLTAVLMAVMGHVLLAGSVWWVWQASKQASDATTLDKKATNNLASDDTDNDSKTLSTTATIVATVNNTANNTTVTHKTVATDASNAHAVPKPLSDIDAKQVSDSRQESLKHEEDTAEKTASHQDPNHFVGNQTAATMRANQNRTITEHDYEQAIKSEPSATQIGNVQQDATLLMRDIPSNEAKATYQTDINVPNEYQQTARQAEELNDKISSAINQVKLRNQQKVNAERDSIAPIKLSTPPSSSPPKLSSINFDQRDSTSLENSKAKVTTVEPIQQVANSDSTKQAFEHSPNEDAQKLMDDQNVANPAPNQASD